jgi:hypothetical protein
MVIYRKTGSTIFFMICDLYVKQWPGTTTKLTIVDHCFWSFSKIWQLFFLLFDILQSNIYTCTLLLKIKQVFSKDHTNNFFFFYIFLAHLAMWAFAITWHPIIYRGPSIDDSYQVSVHLAKRFQRRFLKIGQSETRIAYGGHGQFLFLIGWFLKNLLLWNCFAKWIKTW